MHYQLMHAERRSLGNSGIDVSPVALGCWPIAGVTTLDVNEADSIATIRACFDLGINHLDTAHVYGPNGESERLIARAIPGRRDELVLATKCGIHYEGAEMITDGRPERLRAECEESLRRLCTDRVELLYLHAPDEKVPIEESAGALRELMESGKTRAVGASNCTLEQLRAFQAVCPIAAVQLPYNMLQRDIEQRTIPWCREQGIAVMVYWPLMKGLLAGRLPRDHVLHQRDSRRKYPMYQGDEWQKNQDFVEQLRAAASLSPLPSGRRSAVAGEAASYRAAESSAVRNQMANSRAQTSDPTWRPTIAQLVINWTIHQPGITAALCGAKRRWQIEETAGAIGWTLSPAQREVIDAAITTRGQAFAKRTFS